MRSWTAPHPRRLPDADEVRSTLRDVEELDAELRTLTSQISFLERRVSELYDTRARKTSFIAPFRRLPQEILVKIAKICIDSGDSPSTLNCVCSAMRDAVNGIKDLWGTIHIVPYRSDPKRTSPDDEESHGRLSRRGKVRDPERPPRRSQKDGHFCSTLPHLQTLLERVDLTPIDISITYPVDESILHLAASHAPYFRSLAVMLSSGSFELPLMDLPILENLVVHSTALNSSVRNILQMADDRAPVLHNLCLEIHSPLDFPLTEVARYQFYYRLRSLYLATGSKYPSDPSAPVVDLPELETLTLIGKPWILSYMTLPNLRMLTILGGTKKRNQRIVPPHFPTSITRLHLDHVRFSTYTSSAVLLPHLTHMDLRFPSIEVMDSHFRMPALETMRLDSMTYSGVYRSSPEQSTISALFGGEGVLKDLRSLRRLLIEDIHLETTSCVAFRGIPALQEWEMRACSMPHDLAETLANQSDITSLESIHVKDCWSMSERPELVEQRVVAASSQFRPNLRVSFIENQVQ